MAELAHLLAVGDGQCAVVEWVGALGIGIGTTLPAFDGEAWVQSIKIGII